MNSGTIMENESTNSGGGGIAATNSSSLTLKGGTISSNTAKCFLK